MVIRLAIPPKFLLRLKRPSTSQKSPCPLNRQLWEGEGQPHPHPLPATMMTARTPRQSLLTLGWHQLLARAPLQVMVCRSVTCSTGVISNSPSFCFHTNPTVTRLRGTLYRLGECVYFQLLLPGTWLG